MDGRDMSFTTSFENYQLGLHGIRLPEFEIEKAYKQKTGVNSDCSNFDFLKALTTKGFKEKVKAEKGSDLYKKYIERIKYELDIFSELGFNDYILLVWDVINFCRVNDIATGVGRGSCCGSLILFLIDVTAIDPIINELYFERFVSKIRAKKTIVNGITYLDGSLMPDVDLDIGYQDRIRVIEYLQTKFVGKTSKILTFNTLSGRLLIKECGKVVGNKAESEMTRISEMVPKVFGKVKDIESAYDQVKDFKTWCDENPDIYQIALKLRNLIKNKGVHPSGYVISYHPVEEICALELTSDKELVSCYDMEWMGRLCIKLDLLGLRSASLVHEVCKRVNIKVEDINTNDQLIYDAYKNLLSPHGIFQLEAYTNYRVLQKVKPRNLLELCAVVSLARPGALDFVDQYAAYINEGIYVSANPFFDDILKETGGVPIYQEQLMAMAHKVGFTLDEAEVLRRIVGKKKEQEIKAWKEKIADKIKENGLTKDIGDLLWKVAEDSASYSFNKSHGLAYSTLSAVTTYLKFKYPKEFFISLLHLTRFEPDPITEISKIHQELRLFDIQLLPPDLIKSDLDFKMEGNNIRFGLLSIKGISDKSIEKINKFRNEYSSKFQLFESAQQAGLSIGVLSALIQAGALQSFSMQRSRTVLEAQLWNLLKEKEKTHAINLANEYKHDLLVIVKKMTELKDEKGKPLIKASRMNTIKKHYAPYKDIYVKNHENEDFASWFYEKSLLGYSFGKKLIEIFKSSCPDLRPIDQVNILDHKDRCSFVGTIESIYEGVSKGKGTRYLRAAINDEVGTCNVLLFNDSVDQHKENNHGKIAQKGDIVFVQGQKFNDAIFAKFMNPQDDKIYMKLAQLKLDKKATD